jgi:hypothetical protein
MRSRRRRPRGGAARSTRLGAAGAGGAGRGVGASTAGDIVHWRRPPAGFSVLSCGAAAPHSQARSCWPDSRAGAPMWGCCSKCSTPKTARLGAAAPGTLSTKSGCEPPAPGACGVACVTMRAPRRHMPRSQPCWAACCCGWRHLARRGRGRAAAGACADCCASRSACGLHGAAVRGPEMPRDAWIATAFDRAKARSRSSRPATALELLSIEKRALRENGRWWTLSNVKLPMGDRARRRTGVQWGATLCSTGQEPREPSAARVCVTLPMAAAVPASRCVLQWWRQPHVCSTLRMQSPACKPKVCCDVRCARRGRRAEGHRRMGTAPRGQSNSRLGAP